MTQDWIKAIAFIFFVLWMLADGLTILMIGFLFLAMIWFDFDPSRLSWGTITWGPSPAGLPKIVGWIGIILLFIALPVAWILGL